MNKKRRKCHNICVLLKLAPPPPLISFSDKSDLNREAMQLKSTSKLIPLHRNFRESNVYVVLCYVLSLYRATCYPTASEQGMHIFLKP
jgi:hypothetical protein